MEKVEQVLSRAGKYYLGGITLAGLLLTIYGLCYPGFFSKNAKVFFWVANAIGLNSLWIIAVLVIAYIVVYVKDRRNRRNNQNSDID